jgi:hypothetical protein
MIPASSLRFLDEDRAVTEMAEPGRIAGPAPVGEGSHDGPDPSVEAAEPRVFVRVIATPPGLPWEQARTADLEARHGAPLPIAELLHRLQRLEGWRPGAPGRFAAFYVLAREVDGQLEASAEVEGRAVKVVFADRGAEAGRAAGLALRAGLVGAACLLLTWSAGAAFGKRAELEAALSLAEQKAASKMRLVKARERLRDESRLLGRRTDRGLQLSDVLAELGSAAASKAPDARIESVHWEPGLLALQSRGEAPPLLPDGGLRLERSEAPVEPGLTLWALVQAPIERAQP